MIKFMLLSGLLLVHLGCENQNKTLTERKAESDIIEKQYSIFQFPYVALAYGKPSIYTYDVEKGNFELLWWDQKDFVIALVPDYKSNISFFITASSVGTKGNFPFISKIKLYRIDSDFSKIDFIGDIGSGMQLNAFWNDEGKFELVYTDVDKTISSYINKYLQVYNSFGKLIDDKVETFDLNKSGFPQLLPKKTSTVSRSGRYGISEVNDSVYVRITGNKLHFITEISGNISETGWSDDEEYLFFSTSGTNPDSENTGLFIYNIEKDSLEASWTGPGRKDFFTTGDLLIFEDGLGENSYIVVFNFREVKQLNTFTRKGGSGLKNISESKK